MDIILGTEHEAMMEYQNNFFLPNYVSILFVEILKKLQPTLQTKMDKLVLQKQGKVGVTKSVH